MQRSSVTRRRRGQAAVETMVLSFGIMVVLVAMFHLFMVTWASGQAHMRAREALLHGDSYQTGTRRNYVESGNIPFNTSSSYPRKAVPGTSMEFTARAWDETLEDSFGSQTFQVEAVITSGAP